MKKIFTKILITTVFAQSVLSTFIGASAMQAYAAEQAKTTLSLDFVIKSKPETEDFRVRALEHIFNKYNSPLAPYARTYIGKADSYGIDWKLLPAISGLESSFGNAQLSGSYNSYGWGGGLIYFNSVEDGIDTVLSGLKQNYFSKGANTVYTIAPIYSESPTWAPRVQRFIDEIEAEYEKIRLSKLAITL